MFMGWFMGTGYAIIQQLPNATYPILHHSITGQTDTNAEEFCHATFPDVATWCRYCHEEGHTKFECPKALARIICYNCDKAGHRQDTCSQPKKGSSDREFKKARKTPVTISSTEANKSQWAPNNTKNSDIAEQQSQEKQQRQAQQTGTTSTDKNTKITSTIMKLGSSAKKQIGSADSTNTQASQSMSGDEDTDDDDYLPLASEPESEAEQMSDIKATADEVANLQRDQEEHLAHMQSANGDSNTKGNTTIASSENYNNSAAQRQILL
ncbi:unnamed protein product [Mucor fragilis]